MTQSSDSALVQIPAPSPLEIPELLEIILHKLSRKDNTSTARVCRTWSHPALDRIWREMDSLIPLFNLIGPMAKQSNDEWTFTDDIKDADWSRYAIYAPRIRELFNFDEDFDTRLSILAVRSILAYLPSHLQLPSPASIFFLATAQRPTTLLKLPLISPSLRRLVLLEAECLRRHASPSFALSLQDASRIHHPCLEKLEVSCASSDAAFVEALNACLIKHESRLARLQIKTPFDEQVWSSIFNLSTLRTLDIAPLKADTLGRLEEVIPRIQALVKRQPQLKSLELDLPLRGEPSHSPYFRIIREVMGLRNLETLVLHVNLPLSLTESDVQEMGISWPKMRILALHHRAGDWNRIPSLEVASQTDLSLLPCFLRKLPHIEELHVPFTCDKTLTLPQEQCGASALRTLDMGRSPEPKASLEQVVAYLAAVLPDAAKIVFWLYFIAASVSGTRLLEA